MVNAVEVEVFSTDYVLEVEPKVKKPKKPKKPKNAKMKLPAGPYVLDEVKLIDKYQDSPNHIAIIKNLPRLDMELFYEVEDKINPCKNAKFLYTLHNGSDAKTTIAAFQLTKEKYKEVCGEEWADPWKKSTSGATGVGARTPWRWRCSR